MSLLNPLDDSDLDAMIAAMERIKELEAELARLRLTDAERKALDTAVKMAGDPSPITAPQVFEYAATLRGLLERTK